METSDHGTITLSCLEFDSRGLLCDNCQAGGECKTPVTLRKDSPLAPIAKNPVANASIESVGQ